MEGGIQDTSTDGVPEARPQSPQSEASMPEAPHESDRERPANGASRVNVHSLERAASGILGAALIAGGLKKRSIGGALAALVGGGLVYRGMTGHCHLYGAMGVSTASKGDQTDQNPSRRESNVPEIQRTVTIDQPAAHLHRVWSDPQTLRRVMEPFARVEARSDGRTHWTLRTPIGELFEWDSHIVEDRAGEILRWRSVGGATPASEGTLRFAPAPGNRGTRVSLSLRFDPPAGAVGAAVLKVLRVVPNTFALKALQRFKSLVETGEIPTAEGGPSARESESGQTNGAQRSRIASGLGWFSVGLGLMEIVAPERLSSLAGLPNRPLLLRALGLRELTSGIGILASRQQAPWMWSRVAGDAMDLALLGAALKSPEADRTRASAATAAVMGVTALDAISSWRQTRSSASFRSGNGADAPAR